MNPRELVLSQFTFAHGVLQQIVAEVETGPLHRKLPGSTIDTVASTFAHLVFDEDSIVNGMALGATPVFVSGGWGSKTGMDFPQSPMQSHEWAATVKLDLARFMPYAQAVFANTESVIMSASDEQLAKQVQTPTGATSAMGCISGIGLYHLVHHSGEISALLGVQGLKGLPF